MSAALTEQSLDSLIEIRKWFDSALGEQVLQTERAILDQLLAGYFGYHLLQLSIQKNTLHDASPIQNKISIGLDACAGNAPMIAQANELPFEDDSIDVVLLHHLLDFLAAPLDTLREAARVSLPMGHLVIIGFNPFSTWGAWKIAARLSGRAPWNGQFIRPGRLMDWLNVLNFKIDQAQYCFYRPPIARRRIKQPDYSQGLPRRFNLPIGAVYLIVARKQVGTLTPIRPVWRTQRTFGQLSSVPSARRNSYQESDWD